MLVPLATTVLRVRQPALVRLFGACGLLFCLACALPIDARAARDDEIISQLREQIRELEKAPADTGGIFDKGRNERRLVLLRKELAVIERRQELETQERDLHETMNAQPRAQLREKLQAVAPDKTGPDLRLRELATRRTQVTVERETLARKLADLRRAPGTGLNATTDIAEAEERIITLDEELRAIALRAEAAENESDLVVLAQTLRERLRTMEAESSRPTLRVLFTQQSQEDDDTKLSAQLAARVANLDATQRNGEAGLDLQRQKLAGLDQEILLFEARPGPAQRRNAPMDQLLATDRLQKRMLGERLPFLTDQVEALRRSRTLLQSQQDLLAAAARVLNDDFATMRAAYLARQRTPTVIIAGLIAIYLLLSRLVMPLRYKKEELFLARRLGRYTVAFLAVVIVALNSIADLRVLATTLGVASAGLVIALQDVATSLFGWFTILLGRKFTVGDRLEIDGARGDVLDIQLLRTTLVELNNWLGVDQPTGRVFIVPNNFVFKSKVFNYSHGHPYIWGVVDVTVTFSTPVASALAVFNKALEEETREAFAEARTAAREMERRYGAEDAEYQPKVYTRIADCGITFSLLYVCHYRQTATMRNRLNRRLIAELETHEHIRLAYPTRQVINTVESVAPTAVLGQDSTSAPFLRPVR